MRRRLLATAAATSGAIVLLAASAWACTGLATLSTSRSAPGRGGPPRVDVRGEGFRPGGDEVTVRADDPQGEVLVTARPDTHGAFSVSLDLSSIAAGEHILVAAQHDPGPVASILAKAPLVVRPPTAGPASGGPAFSLPHVPVALPWVLVAIVGILGVAGSGLWVTRGSAGIQLGTGPSWPLGPAA